jgi:CheY-like chemotaxis protein
LRKKAAEKIGTITSAQKTIDFLSNNYVSLRKAGKPVLIFLDLAMPKMNGFKFLEQCMELQVLDNNMQICILTDSFRPGDKSKALALGASWFISKPLTKVKLQPVLNVSSNN